MLAGGIREVLSRRLSRVPIEAQSMLNVIALIGRQVDLTVLNALFDPVKVGIWVQQCAEIAVLEVHDEGWWFSHDKLREALIKQLSEGEKQHYHQMAATGLEHMYANDARRAGSLADHWFSAKNAPKAVHYALIAAESVFSVSQYAEALRLLERVLSFIADAPLTDQAKAYRLLGETYFKLGEYDPARMSFEKSIAIAKTLNEPIVWAEALNGLAFLEVVSDHYDVGIVYAEEALLKAQPVDDIRNIARAINTKGTANEYKGDLEKAFGLYQQALSLYRILKDQRGVASVLNNLGSIADTQGQYIAAEAHYGEALMICENIGYRQAVGILNNNLGVLCERLKAFDRAYQHYSDSLQIGKDVKDKRNTAYALGNRANVAIALEQLANAQQDVNEALQISTELELVLILHDIMTAQAIIWLKEGKQDKGLEWAVAISQSTLSVLDFRQIRLPNVLKVIRQEGLQERYENLLATPSRLDVLPLAQEFLGV